MKRRKSQKWGFGIDLGTSPVRSSWCKFYIFTNNYYQINGFAQNNASMLGRKPTLKLLLDLELVVVLCSVLVVKEETSQPLIYSNKWVDPSHKQRSRSWIGNSILVHFSPNKKLKILFLKHPKLFSKNRYKWYIFCPAQSRTGCSWRA